jgi:hypothetical protein
VAINSYISCDITQCGPVQISQSFGRTYYLHLQGRRVNQEETSRSRQQESETYHHQHPCEQNGYTTRGEYREVRCSGASNSSRVPLGGVGGNWCMGLLSVASV